MIETRTIARLRTPTAVHRFIAKRYRGDTDRFVYELDSGLTRLLRTDLGRARHYLEHALRCLAALPEHHRPRGLAMQARLAHWSGRFARALDLYRQALQGYIRQRDFYAAARTRRALVEVNMYLGRYEDALREGKKALRYFRRQGLESDAAQVMTNIGNVYHRMDRNRQALRMYEQARKIFAGDGGIPLAIVDFNRANIYANLNDLKRAAALYQAAARQYQRAGLELAEAQARYSLAYLFFLENSFAEALRTLERVHEVFSRLGDERSAAVTQLDLAEINLHLNQYGSAVWLAEQIIPRFRSLGMRYEQAKAHYLAAWGHAEMRNPARAAAQLSAARRLFAAEGNELWQGMVAYLQARMHLAGRRWSLAARTASQAGRWFRRSGDVRRGYDATILRLRAGLGRGAAGSAARLERLLSNKGLTSMQRFAIWESLGEHQMAQGRPTEALRCFRGAVKEAEKMLGGLQQDEIRFFFAANKYQVYARVVECLLALGRVQASFVFNLKALALINQPVAAMGRLRHRLPPHLLESIVRLRRDLNRLQRMPRSSKYRAVATDSSRLEQQLWIQQRKARALLERSRSAHQRRRRLEHHAELLRPDETLIDFVTLGDTLGAFVADRRSVRFVRCAMSTSALEELLRKFNFVAEQTVYTSGRHDRLTVTLNDYLAELSRGLVRPLLSGVSTSRLLILAEGTVAPVPFAALPDETGARLCERMELHRLVTPESLSGRRGGSIDFRRQRNAVIGMGSAELPMAEVECRHIRRLFPGAELLLGEAATTAALREHLARSNGFVHIATHAARSAENPLFSRLMMADGPLFPFDLYTEGVSARLVVLSGCQTAAPGLYYGSAYSLAKAVHQAGARYVLASLWSVADRLTMVFMTEFYRHLSREGAPPEAWRRAVNTLAERTENPALWGAFVLLGV